MRTTSRTPDAAVAASDWQLDDAIPDRLPLLDALIDERAAGARPFRSMTAILVQHQTGSIVAMVRALSALGLSLERCFFIDIPYSAHPAVRRRLVGLGIPEVNLAASDYRLGEPLAVYQRRRADEVLGRAAPGERLLVLDDGAYISEALSQHGPPAMPTAVVEQTVFGMRKVRERPQIRALARLLPLVNVAESCPKKALEAAFLGTAIVHALGRSAVPVRERIERGPTLLIGFGAIGRAVAEALRAAWGIPAERLHVHDTRADARRSARAAGCRLWSRTDGDAPLFDVVIGCTGRAAFGPRDVGHLTDGAVLASASSGAIEFSCDELLARAEEHDGVHIYGEEPLAERDIHQALRIRVADRDVVLLNGGFPVDFDGHVNCVPPSLIQLTRTLMVGGAMQAVASRDHGVLDLDSAFSDWVTRRFAEIVG